MTTITESSILVACIALLWVGHWYGALFSQAFFNHRYMTHRQFKMSKSWERVFYILSFIVQGAGYLSMRAYVIMHRMHHAYSDEKRDPHSPRYFLTMLGLIWNMGKRHALLKTYDPEIPDEQQMKAINQLNEKSLAWFKDATPVNAAMFENLPEPSKLDTAFDSKWCRYAWIVAWALPYLIASFVIIDFNLWQGLFIIWALYPFHLLMIPIQGTLVNWFGHSTGYQNFDNKDDSTNVFARDLILWGETLQNNHHHAPARPNFAFKKKELDIIYKLILILNGLGIVELKKVENNL